MIKLNYLMPLLVLYNFLNSQANNGNIDNMRPTKLRYHKGLVSVLKINFIVIYFTPILILKLHDQSNCCRYFEISVIETVVHVI